jgi:hypothetical protein
LARSKNHVISSSFNFLQPPVTSTPLGDISLSRQHSRRLSEYVFSFCSHLHKTRKIIVTGMNTVTLMFFGREWEDADSKLNCSKHSRIQSALHFELHCFEFIKHVNKTWREV